MTAEITPTPTHGWAAQDATSPLAPISFERRAPGPRDVAIEIAWCGICHSDVHTARSEWPGTTYPCVPGHEIVGTVTAVGADVSRFAVGDTVGVGCLVDSCHDCAPCTAGEEQYCEKDRIFTYNSPERDYDHPTYGGYSNAIVVDQHFVLRIPDGLDPAAAAPILCAGITTWSPLKRYGVGPGTKVGVAGFGGLGLMAIKLAKALGAEVVAITRSESKAAEARALGADDVIVSVDRAQMRAHAGTLNLIIDTIPVTHPLNPYLKLLALDGVLHLVGAVEPITEPLGGDLLIAGRLSVAGSLIGGLADTQECLDFCAEHGIVARIETIGVEEINAAYDRLAAGQLDFRYVIDMSTLSAATEAAAA